MGLSSAALLTALLAVTACSPPAAARVDKFGLPLNRPITRADLRTHAEAALSYPGSQLVETIGADQSAKPNGQEPDPAYTGAIRTAATTPAQLYRWYAQWLTARGYHPVPYYRLSDQLSGAAWQVPNGREQVQIAVFDPRLLASDQKITVTVPTGGLIYEELLVAYPPTNDTPHTSAGRTSGQSPSFSAVKNRSFP